MNKSVIVVDDNVDTLGSISDYPRLQGFDILVIPNFGRIFYFI